jgi:ABC-type uncharacterized transport system substrate-binding protein
MKNDEAGAVVIQGSLSTKIVAQLALKYRLPAATVPRSFTEVGGLMSYSFAESEALRRSALFVIKILQGEKPADIPVESPASSNWQSTSKRQKRWTSGLLRRFCYGPKG